MGSSDTTIDDKTDLGEHKNIWNYGDFTIATRKIEAKAINVILLVTNFLITAEAK